MLCYIAGMANRGGGNTPYPPGERQQSQLNSLNQGFIQLNLRQSYSE